MWASGSAPRTARPVLDDARVIRLAVALFAVQAGFHGFTAALPVALAQAGIPDPEIGLIVGIAALVQIPAAFVAGIVVDRLGGIRAFVAAGVAYLIGCAILLAPGVEPGGPSWPFMLARASRAWASPHRCLRRCRSFRGWWSRPAVGSAWRSWVAPTTSRS